MKKILIVSFLLCSCAIDKPKEMSFQECSVNLVARLKFRNALGLLSKSCYLVHGNHTQGDQSKKIGKCIVNNITNIRTKDEGEKLIKSCSEDNLNIQNFLIDELNED